MMTLVASITIAFAANSGLYSGEVPENVPTFRITFPNDSNEYWGAFIMNNEWVTDRNALESAVKRVDIVFDTPWDPQVHHSTLLNKITIEYEAPALRKTRLEKGWENAGYVFIEVMENGGKVSRPILKTELELAERARAMAETLEQELHPPAPVNGSDTDPEPAPPAPKPGFLQIWGAHVALLALGLILLALILKFLLLKK
ncbi:MAG TPA: hypothetical protein PLI09_28180 [Candidatus Hydrogenedentes bacterium]|nr:hypothetical protein [Candidatus Hydrogenedentota bacterium]